MVGSKGKRIILFGSLDPSIPQAIAALLWFFPSNEMGRADFSVFCVN